MERQILEQPFPDHLIRWREGQHGRKLAYVEGAEYVKRLNEAFDGDWSFEIDAHRVLDREVVVLGKLVANGVTKVAFGGSSITKNKQTGEPVSLADDLKAAATDALKKACSLLGVGLHLYGSREDEKPGAKPAGQSNRPRPVNGNGDNGNGRRELNGDRITQRQLSTIWSLGREVGLNADQIRARTSQQFGAQPEQLTKTEASSVISALYDSRQGLH